MSAEQGSLSSILDLEQIGQNLFRGHSPQTTWQRVFGGQVIGQALAAGSRTIGDRLVHSLHAYFMRPGDPAIPILYQVERLRDGRSFATRRVTAFQHGFAIFEMLASFHLREEGFDHHAPMPAVPMPEELASGPVAGSDSMSIMPAPVRSYFERKRAIELRPVELNRYSGVPIADTKFHVWIRLASPLPDNEALHRCALAYASDMTLLDVSLTPFGRSIFETDIAAASIDHAMWFHRSFRPDEWLLYAQDSPNVSGARGLSRGLIFRRDGALVASVMQEGLIRERNRTAS